VTGTVALAWFVATAGLLAWALTACVLQLGRDHTNAAASRAAPRQVSMRLLFLSDDGPDLVLDALLDLEGQAVGVPTTWLLSTPDDERARNAIVDVLERWIDEGAEVEIDVSMLRRPSPALALSHDDAHVELVVSGHA
jgi:hypothetical protein